MLPEFFVVRHHEIFCDSGAEGIVNPIAEILNFGLSFFGKCIHETEQAFFYDVRRKSKCVRLERVISKTAFQKNRRLPLMLFDFISQELIDDALSFRSTKVHEMAGAIEMKTIHLKRFAKSSDLILRFDQNVIVRFQMIGCAEPRQPGAN